MPRIDTHDRPQPAPPTLAVVVNTRNEEANLAACLDSVAHVVDEIVVVDMYSEDRTVEIARRYTEKVFLHEKTGYVEPARQFAIEKASSDWVLLLDADERATPELAVVLRALINEADGDVFFIPEKTWISGRWMQGTGFGTDVERHPRLFRRGAIEWPTRIHSVPQIRGKHSEVPLPENARLEHWAHRNLYEFIETSNRYTNREAEALEQDGIHWSLEDMLRATQSEIEKRYEPEKDGVHSLVLSTCMGFYRFLSWAKLWERQAYPQAKLPPSAADFFAALAEPWLLDEHAQLCCGAGFHADEGGWRWMGREGEICIASRALPADLSFALTCDRGERYQPFPFLVQLQIGSWDLGRILFESDEQMNHIRIALGPSSSTLRICLQSEASFVPCESGVGEDRRRLSIRISNLKLEPLEDLNLLASGLRIGEAHEPGGVTGDQ